MPAAWCRTAGRLPAKSPALQKHMPFFSSSISACSPPYTIAEKGSCRVQKWKKIKKELEWLCSSHMWWLPTCSKHHRWQRGDEGEWEDGLPQFLAPSAALWEKPLGQLQQQQHIHLLHHGHCLPATPQPRAFKWFLISHTAPSGQERSSSVQTNLLLSVCLSCCLFIYLPRARGVSLSGHHDLSTFSYKCFCRLGYSHVTISFPGPHILTAKVGIFHQCLCHIKGLFSLWVLFSLAKHFSPLL